MGTLRRKDEHIELSLRHDVEMRQSTWLECVMFVHQALPRHSLDAIDTSVEAFGRRFSLPLLINSLTGGTARGREINERLATVAHEFCIPLALGSIRAAVENSETLESFRVARGVSDDIFLIANIGLAQVLELPASKLADVIRSLEADALAVHLNPLQESLQPEGEPFTCDGFEEKLRELKDELRVPIIVKEVGCGISYEVARALCKLPIDAIDVEGAGGTSFAYIEGLRALAAGDEETHKVALTFKDWGIPTAASVWEVRNALNAAEADVLLIAGGGIRTGLDGARALALGADMFAMARPFLEAACRGVEHVRALVRRVMREFRLTMYLTGARTVSDLRRVPVVILDPLRAWIEQRKAVVCKS